MAACGHVSTKNQTLRFILQEKINPDLAGQWLKFVGINNETTYPGLSIQMHWPAQVNHWQIIYDEK